MSDLYKGLDCVTCQGIDANLVSAAPNTTTADNVCQVQGKILSPGPKYRARGNEV